MSGGGWFRRLRGLLVALGLAAAVAAALVWSRPAPPPAEVAPPRLFRFEKEDLVRLEVRRPDVSLKLAEGPGGQWTVDGQAWRPSRQMIRRVAHQLHDLTARAEVAEAVDDPSLYGLGPEAIEVVLGLRDGSEHRMRVGDPNPTSVSYYVQPLPDGRVFIVKKASVDYYRLSVDDFREDRIAWLDAEQARLIEVRAQGRRLRFELGADDQWMLREPTEFPAERDVVRSILGRLAASRRLGLEAEEVDDPSGFGVAQPPEQVVVTLSDGSTVEVQFGRLDTGTDPAERLVYLPIDRAVYRVREGVYEELVRPIEDYRERDVVGAVEPEVASYDVVRDGETLSLRRDAEDWRWPDDSPVAGITPRRVAERAAGLAAAQFLEAEPPGFVERARVVLHLTEGRTATLRLGEAREVQGRRLQPVHYQEGDQWLEADGGLQEVLDDLRREYQRKLDRDGERRLRLGEAGGEVDPAAP